MSSPAHAFKSTSTLAGGSLSFVPANDSRLTRTPSLDGSEDWVFSCWFYRTITPAAFQGLLSGGVKNIFTKIGIDENNRLMLVDYLRANAKINLAGMTTTTSYNAWNHLYLAFNPSNATESLRAQMWVNGIAQTLSEVTAPLPVPLNHSSWITDTKELMIGHTETTIDDGTGSEKLVGIVHDMILIDGGTTTSHPYSMFYETDTIRPASYYAPFGAQGFFLRMTDAANLGLDSSGNGNHFTATNLTTANISPLTPIVK